MPFGVVGVGNTSCCYLNYAAGPTTQGPILAVTFGTVIRDRELWTMGLKNELIGLAICFVTGFLGGLVFGSFGEDFNWPSDFMLNR